MNLAPIQSDIAQTSKKNELVIGVPECQYMIPGKTYVGRLPGHSRKAFVRKPLLQVARVRASPHLRTDKSHAVGGPAKMPRWIKSMFGSDYHSYDDHYKRRRVTYTDGPYHSPPPSRTPPNTRQVCSACGKFRSPSWSARHSLRYGEVPKPGLCRKCVGKSTSSAESPWHPRKRRPRPRCSHTRHSHCTHDDCSRNDSSRDLCRSRRRHKSDSLGYIKPRSLVRSGSGERVNIVIRNEGLAPKARLRTMSSSGDSVRVIRRISVDRPVRRRISRSLSSGPSFTFTDEFVEEIIPPRRPLSRTRRRSRSSVHFVDELKETRYRHRPKIPSRHSSVQEIMVSRPCRSSHRRRPLYCDGAADAKEKSESSATGMKRMGIANSFVRVATSESRQGTSFEFENLPLPITTSHARISANVSPNAPTIPAYEYRHSRPEDWLQNSKDDSEKFHTLPRVKEDPSKPDRAWVAFSDPGYDVDSQFPSPPSVTCAVPLRRPSRRPLPLHVSKASAPSNTNNSEHSRRHTEPLSPAYSNDEYMTTLPHHVSYERVRHNSEPLSPPDSRQGIRKAPNPSAHLPSSKSVSTNAAATTADNPNHPDHLAFLLSKAQIL